MKVTVHNLGIIREAEIDLKPLTIFVGPNNAGKTWLAYALAGIFGPHGFGEYFQAYLEEKVPDTYALLDNAIEQVLSNGSATFDLVQFAEEHGEIYFNNVAGFTRHWIAKFMSTEIASYEHLEISIDLAETKAGFLERVLSYSMRSEISGGRQKPSLSIRKRREERELFVYTSTQYASTEDASEERILEQLPADLIKEFLARSVLLALHRAIFPHVRILPTERTAYIAFPFGSRVVNKEQLTIEEISPQKRKTKATMGPVSSFMNMIQTTFKDVSVEREERAKSNLRIREYVQLAQLLEKQILSGEVNFSQPELNLAQGLNQSDLDSAREILFLPTKDVKVEISIASSMVKELTPLVLYLRYVALPGELLIIDEPEMNLHPEAQAKIIEFLAMLVNAGLNVLITTHSPYVVDHLANLIKAAKNADKEAVSNEFYLKRKDAFISQDKVSVYLVEDGQVKNALDEDGVIQWNTFGEVSDRISEIYFTLR